MERLLKVEEVAKILNVGIGTIRHWVWEGSIPFIKIGGSIRFRSSQIESWAKKRSHRERKILGGIPDGEIAKS